VRALRINPEDVQARYNLAFVHTDAGEYPEALVRIAEALALDKGHQFREALLRKQTEILTREDQQWQQQFRLMANRVSHRLSPETRAESGPGFEGEESRSPPFEGRPRLAAAAEPAGGGRVLEAEARR
jgi:hypothetical protein